MSKKLFVGGLSWGTTEDSLRSAFEQFGSLHEVKVITDRETGRSRGFGFVTFAEGQDADNAISQMDGQEFEGRMIKVNEAKEREPRGFGGGGAGRRSNGGFNGGGRRFRSDSEY